jgi:hypothetical protein
METVFIMDKTKIPVVIAALTLLALSLVACSSTKAVTTSLRTDLENSGMNLNNSSLRYYLDRDVELKASTTTTTMNEGGKGVEATTKKTRNYVLITDGTAGICKEIGSDWIKISFEPDIPNATLKFVKNKDGKYRIDGGSNGLIVYNGLNFQIQSKPSYWWNRFLSVFSSGYDGRKAVLEIEYDAVEKETVKNRKAKGY